MTALRLLIVEDSVDDAELLVAELEAGGFDVSWERVETDPALRHALAAGPWDLIVSDYSMPQFDGMRAFAIIQELGIDAPFIFVSGALGEERAVEAMRAGARDYLLKGNLKRLNAAVRRELAEADNRRGLREAEEARRVSERRYESIFESAGAALVEVDLRGVRRFLESLRDDAAARLREDAAFCEEAVRRATVLDLNATALALFGGKDKREFLGPIRVQPANLDLWREIMCALAAGLPDLQVSGWREAADGKRRHVLVSARIPHAGLDYENVVFSLFDITERQELQEQLWATQRIDSIGRLAGGVAHDFNNILTIITSHASFLREPLAGDETASEDLEVMLQAADKAASLTRQLLAFGRRQVQRLRVLSIGAIVDDLHRMLRRLIGDDVRLKTIVAPDLGFVEADPSNIEQILMNLAVNARDAMPNGGMLTIEVSNVELDEVYARAGRAMVPPGSYVMMAVSDTGTGMDEATMSRIFEPFFTTKPAGKGTGLGLSTVYGIVKQSRGHVWVYSEPGQGTTFKVYLPRVEKTGHRAVPSRPPADVGRRGQETILVVEDQELVRRAAVRILSERGYTVLEASGGEEAIGVAASHRGRIHLVLSDIVMPGLSGKNLVDRLLETRPDMQVLYMSGYTDNAIVHHGVLDAATAFIEKPFSPESLASQVRAVLDGKIPGD